MLSTIGRRQPRRFLAHSLHEGGIPTASARRNAANVRQRMLGHAGRFMIIFG
jgi:hypothetical protein